MSVKENQRGRSKFGALVKANDLALYTIQICTNEKVFKPEYKSALTNDLIKLAKDIYIHVWAANDINVGKDSGKWRIRKSLQEKAIAECGTLLATIEIAHRLFHLKANRESKSAAAALDPEMQALNDSIAQTGVYGLQMAQRPPLEVRTTSASEKDQDLSDHGRGHISGIYF